MMSPELEAMYQRERARQRESERQAALHRLSDQRSRIQNSLETGSLTFPPLGATLEAIRQSIRLGFQRAIQDLSLSPPDSLPVSTPVFPPVDSDARWRGVIVPPAVVLILGKRGGGKSALAYRLLELLQYQLTPFVVGAPSRSQRLFPEWIGICPSLDELPQDCIALVDEAYLLYHSRQSSAATSRDMSQQLNLSRQRNQTRCRTWQFAFRYSDNGLLDRCKRARLTASPSSWAPVKDGSLRAAHEICTAVAEAVSQAPKVSQIS